MQSLKKCRGWKAIPLLFFIFLCAFGVLAIDNCYSPIQNDKLPCDILLPSTDDCTTITITFYLNNETLSSQSMSMYSPEICFAVFNYTTLGTYSFNYTTGDSGAIIVEEGNKMINLFYVAFLVIIVLMALGLYLGSQPLLLIDGLVMLILGLWFVSNGYSIYNNMITAIIGTVLIGVGGYFTVMSGMAMVEGDADNVTD